ncbi:haloacid dehalogenase type II [Rhodoplanes sp. TEM]|uniref:(S)-2-haloacid dehalogenase n=1 Tax=Rhodoplanes tepidamans TaxID=200616 RepID=A0ABT5JHT4_RHOTP|nr:MULTISPECIES: haloacid dehalogenase type II [Rhodoplanes]MDC7788931.1 haloacid dehalogenase type II [Rhodoplanes tepidamans]MDC7987246.1 haloacid dehalogenase type II [Rhodoplanes sp. TEM]MDQ0358624.1 2-haloacid dehalogenase [Rhodoplanes tepidamans]
MPVFVFDAYGTLFDVHAAIARHRDAIGPEADRLSDLWRTKQLEYTWTLSLAGRFVDFWTLTERALDFSLARFPSVDPAMRPRLLDAYRVLDAYPDARETLQALKAAGKRTAILSNGTFRMLASAVEAAGLGPCLDAVLSVESVGVYKPRPEVYRLVIDTFAVAPAEVAFVSSNRWDVMGAAAYGFRTAWINRAGLPEEYHDLAPRCVLTTLAELPGPRIADPA